MALATPADISVQIVVHDDTTARPLVSAERRITPSWTIGQLKTKLEPVTGIPSSCQSLRTRSLADGSWTVLEDDTTLVSQYKLHKNSEIEVVDTRPPGARGPSFTPADLSQVEKYQMPEEQYEQLEDSVLAWKRRQKLGRFNPTAKTPEELQGERTAKDAAEMAARHVAVGRRCRVGQDDGRRGLVKFTGEIPGLGGLKEAGCLWVGVELDEPVGRNDGTVTVETADGPKPQKVFECRGPNYGVLARPEKMQIGDFPPLDDLGDDDDDDMEEI